MPTFKNSNPFLTHKIIAKVKRYACAASTVSLLQISKAKLLVPFCLFVSAHSSVADSGGFFGFSGNPLLGSKRMGGDRRRSAATSRLQRSRLRRFSHHIEIDPEG